MIHSTALLSKGRPSRAKTISCSTFSGGNSIPQNLYLIEHQKKMKGRNFIRGATPESGIHCNIVYHYAWFFGFGKPISTNMKDGSFDLHTNSSFSELMVRNRTMQLIDAHGSPLEDVLKMVADGHHSYSKIFKPEIYAVIRLGDYYPRNERSIMLQKTFTKPNQTPWCSCTPYPMEIGRTSEETEWGAWQLVSCLLLPSTRSNWARSK